MGGTGGAARLAYLPSKQAEELRARLLALSRGAHEDTPEPQEDVLVTVPVARVVGSLAFSGPALVLLVYAVAFAVGDVLGPDATRAVTGSAAAILIADAVALWRRFNRAYGATVADAPEGLRIRSGLVETTAETIPTGRVQAVQLVEPFLWRPFGWCRRRRRRRGPCPRRRRGAPARAAAASRAPCRHPGRGAARARATRPRRARARPQAAAARALEVAAPLPPALVRVRSTATRSRRPGGCRAIESWVPLTKVQSLRRIEGPVQRRLRLATMHLDTAGKRVGAAFRDLDGEESIRELDRLTELARAARRA